MQTNPQYDVIVLGAGPAGFTAGIYLSRFLFKTLLLDTLRAVPYHRGAVRSVTPGAYHNVPGFPGGIERHELKARGVQQARETGCDYHIDRAIAITRDGNLYVIHTESGKYTGKHLFFALGVEDDWDHLPGAERLAGHSLFWSVELNGKESLGRPAAVLGHDDLAVQEVLRLYLFTKPIYLLTHGEKLRCSEPERMMDALTRFSIPVIEQRIRTLKGEGASLEQIIFEDNKTLPINIIYAPSEFQAPRNELAKNLGVRLDSRGYIIINDKFETNIPNVYAIGDLATRTPHKSVLSAFYQGMEAAWNIHDKKFQDVIHRVMSSLT